MTDASRPSPADLDAILRCVDDEYRDFERSVTAKSPQLERKLVEFVVNERMAWHGKQLAAEVRALQQELRAAKEGAAHLAQRQIMDEAWGGGIRDVDDSLRDNPPAEAKYFCCVCPECGCAVNEMARYDHPLADFGGADALTYKCYCGHSSQREEQPERWVTAEGKPLTQYETPRWDSGHAPPFPHPFDVEEGTATC